MDNLTYDHPLPAHAVATRLPVDGKGSGARAPRIAFVHEWLTTYAGSEKVLQAMMDEFPSADLFCLIDCFTTEERAQFGHRRPKTTFMQRIPFVRKLYPYLLFLMPFAVESHDLSGYDIVVSNSHAVAKGALTSTGQMHICYCYSPMRYAWDLQKQYLAEAGMSKGPLNFIAQIVMHRMRIWDIRSSFSVDHYIACSGYIAERIRKTYRRDAAVIYPNVAVDAFTPGERREDFYLTASRLTPYKRVLLIVEAFRAMPQRRLVVIGDGKQFRRIARAAPPNVTMMGYQSFEVLREHMQKARAFIFAAEEDFGITPVEAQACGTPVLAYGRGGACESVVHGTTGLHFQVQSAAAIRDCVLEFERNAGSFDAARIRAHALKFSTARFRNEFRQLIEETWDLHERRMLEQRQPRFGGMPATA